MHDDDWYPIAQTDTATLSLRRFGNGDVAVRIEDLGAIASILLTTDQGQEISAELALATYPRKGATP